MIQLESTKTVHGKEKLMQKRQSGKSYRSENKEWRSRMSLTLQFFDRNMWD